MKEFQNTSSQSFRHLMGNGFSYVIPKFQRDYAWDLAHWDDLWQDIQALRHAKDTVHYMGYLVLQSPDESKFTVVDGAQRLTTFNILVLSVLSALKELELRSSESAENKKRREALHATLIAHPDPAAPGGSVKLTLNRNNDTFYRDVLVALAPLPDAGLNASETLLRNCFSFFHAKVSAEFFTGADLAAFLDLILDRMYFTVLLVADEMNAFRVFETFNNRNVRLSSADMLKHHLFTLAEKPAGTTDIIRELDALWDGVTDSLGAEALPEFLRVFWNSRNKYVRHNDLFAALEAGIKTKDDAFNLVRDLTAATPVYKALMDPEDLLWNDRPGVRPLLRELKMFGTRHHIPLLLTGFRELPPPRFEPLVKACTAVAFRYNVIGALNPNDQEKLYNKIALAILRDKSFAPMDFHAVYPSDDEFEKTFARVEFQPTARNHAIVCYIFARLEQHAFKKEIDPRSEHFAIEHIMPENPSANWGHIQNDELRRAVYRLGNLAVIESPLRKQTEHKSFDEKKVVYATSAVESTKAVSNEYRAWNEAVIAARQAWMARLARLIWKA